jgi:hypothetical protein
LELAHRQWLKAQGRPANPQEFLQQFFLLAHTALNQRSAETGTQAIASLVAIFFQDSQLHIAHSGDCRCYLLRGKSILHRTQDHSVAQLLVQRGKITEAEMISHPDKGRVLRSVGGNEWVEPETSTHSLKPTDRLLLCSDGLWERITPDEITQVAAQGNQAAIEHLVNLALQRGGKDTGNIELILLTPQPSLGCPAMMPRWIYAAVAALLVSLSALGIWSSQSSPVVETSPGHAAPQVVVASKEQRLTPVPITPPPGRELPPPPQRFEPKPVAPQAAPTAAAAAMPMPTAVVAPLPKPAAPVVAEIKLPTEPVKPLPKATLTVPRTIGFSQDTTLTNSLGMTLVYAGRDRLYFSVHETTAQQYARFTSAEPTAAKLRPDLQPDHPAAGVSYAQAVAFCRWLTQTERSTGRIGLEDAYALPTDVEWTQSASWRDLGPGFDYPWKGKRWPPSVAVANLGQALEANGLKIKTVNDGFDGPAPVGSFFSEEHHQSPHGLTDLAGNVAEWTSLPSFAGASALRGGGWTDTVATDFRSDQVSEARDGAARPDSGFRCVLRIAAKEPTLPQPVAPPPKVTAASQEKLPQALPPAAPMSETPQPTAPPPPAAPTPLAVPGCETRPDTCAEDGRPAAIAAAAAAAGGGS